MNIREQRGNNENFLISEKKKPDSSKEKNYSMEMASGLVTITDFLILLVSGFCIYWYYVGWDNANVYHYSFGVISLSAAVIVIFHNIGLYDITSLSDQIARFQKIFLVLAVTFMFFLALVFALKISDQFSRVWVFSWFITSFSLISGDRALYHLLFRRCARTGKIFRRIVVVGSGLQARKLLERIVDAHNPWVKVEGVFDAQKGSELFKTFIAIGCAPVSKRRHKLS